MIPIIIDTSDLSAEFNLSKKEIDGLKEFVVKELTSAFARNWDTQARNKLGGTRVEYRKSLIVGEEGRFKGFVMLIGMLPNMIESGVPAFDMKPGFLQGKKAKSKPTGGRYLTIPLRYAAPESLAESSVFAGQLPTAVHEAIKEKEVSGQKTRLEIDDIPESYQVPKLRAEIPKSAQFGEYMHKTSLFVGLTRVPEERHRQYITFRRVSDLSEPSSWIHSGIIARNLAEKALEETNIPQEVDMAADKYLTGLGF